MLIFDFQNLEVPNSKMKKGKPAYNLAVQRPGFLSEQTLPNQKNKLADDQKELKKTPPNKKKKKFGIESILQRKITCCGGW